MPKTIAKTELIGLLREAGEVFKLCSRKTKILSTLSWNPEVAQEFFRKGESSLPQVNYAIDNASLTEVHRSLKNLAPKLKGEHPVHKWLARMQESFALGIRLLQEVETDVFYEISTQIYGNSQSRLFNSPSTNLNVARAISSRMSVCNLNDIQESVTLKSAVEFADDLQKRLSERQPILPVRIEFTDQIVAKVIAGMNRVRIRKDTRFSELELRALWNHEIESHCLTAHNGASQEYCDFLSAGGPRSTMTQEGLAVFYEVYGHTMSQRRFLTLCDRLEAVHKVESGADFLELYRWYKERSDNPTEAFY
jgi:uncharacterized protein (TIGR02421 family)